MRSVAVAAAGLFVVLAPSSAFASEADGSQQITHYAESVVLDEDGTARVSLDLTLDFADVPGHGPFLSIPVREATDDGRVRVYEVDGFTASSPSGAPAGVSVEDAGDSVEVRIGDPAVGDVDGVQQYHVDYLVGGLINTDATTGDGDQLYWDPIGPDWELPLSDVSVAVSGPGAPERVRCFAGEVGSTASCSSADATKAGAVFRQDALSPGEALTVVAGWPAGTFPGAHAVFESSDSVSDTDGSSDESDDAWAEEGLPEDLELGDDGLPPSFVQGSDGEWVEASSSAGASFSAFGVVLGLGILGVIVAIVVAIVRNASGPGAPPSDVMSLAARGYLRMDPVEPERPGGRANWKLVPLRPADDGMTARERAWYGAMFAGGLVPVYWSHVRPPVHHTQQHHSAFSGGGGIGGGGGFGGDAGAGGGAGGGGGGSW